METSKRIRKRERHPIVPKKRHLIFLWGLNILKFTSKQYITGTDYRLYSYHKSEFFQITTETNSTFLVICFSRLLEYVSSSISESPLSEYSSSLGTSGTLAFLVLGGRAGGASAAGLLVVEISSVGRLRWNPLVWRWPALSVLESWELTLSGRDDWGADVLLKVREGMGEAACSWEGESTPISCFGVAEFDLMFWIPVGESEMGVRSLLLYMRFLDVFLMFSRCLLWKTLICHNKETHKNITQICFCVIRQEQQGT